MGIKGSQVLVKPYMSFLDSHVTTINSFTMGKITALLTNMLKKESFE